MLDRALPVILVLLLSMIVATGYAQVSRPAVTKTISVEKTDAKADGLIFSTELKGRQKSREKRPDIIFTGYFSSLGEETETETETETDSYFTYMPETVVESEVKEPKTDSKGSTLAWKASGSPIYHDPLVECATNTQRIWINDISNLNGCAACEECFIKKKKIPQFIHKESGGLDVATAGALLDRNGFIEWMSSRLPVKNPEFVSDKKLIVYPSEEMTAKGRKNLAREVAMAYRRHTWRVVEVQVNTPKGDADPVNSF